MGCKIDFVGLFRIDNSHVIKYKSHPFLLKYDLKQKKNNLKDSVNLFFFRTSIPIVKRSHFKLIEDHSSSLHKDHPPAFPSWQVNQRENLLIFEKLIYEI